MTKNIKRDVRVVLKSSDATIINNGSYIYNIDWSSILEDEPYIMSYSFITQGYNIGTNTTSGVLSLATNVGGNPRDLSNMRTGALGGTSTSALYSPVLGVFYTPRGTNGQGFMMNKATTNAHHYLERRPYSNQFILSMRNVNIVGNSNPGSAVKHMIILNFRPANKYLNTI